MVANAHDATGAGQGAYTGRPSPLRPTAGSVAFSVVLAGLTFVVVPFFGLLSEAGHERLEVLAVDTVSVPPPPPVVRPEAKEREQKKPPPKLEAKPKPRERRRRIQALRTRISLNMSSLMPGTGDFSLDFGIGEGMIVAPEDEGPPVFELAELDSPPRPLVRIRPLYPFRARERGLEGFVRLLFIVASDGSVGEVEILHSEPEDVFDRAARAAIRRWRFSPGTKGGQPVATRVRITMRFRLNER